MGTQSNPILTLSVVAAGAITGSRCVGYDANQVAAGATATQGIARHDAAVGEQVALDVEGAIPVEAGAAVSVGDLVEANASGKVITKAAGLTVGRALEAAGADGDFIRVLLIKS